MPDHAKPLREQDAPTDPLTQFHVWFEEARGAVREPEAMAVASATRDGHPSVRIVLCKAFDEAGFVFFTNTSSRKGRELITNPRAMLLFHWDALGRQVRIEGEVQPVHRDEALAYAHSRPRGSQLSALASAQSRPIASREELEARVRELEAAHAGAEIPLKDEWGGYRLRPELYEFWQNRRDRLHDRLQYSRDGGGGWKLARLQP